jgi:hypothetical protein
MLFGKIIDVYSGNQAPSPGAEHVVRMTEKRKEFPQNKALWKSSTWTPASSKSVTPELLKIVICGSDNQLSLDIPRI